MDDGLNANTNNFKDLLTSFGLKQNICSSTHKRGHILDLLITRVNEELLSSLDIITNTLSDHAAITCKLEMPRPPPLKRVLTFRKLRNIDMDSLRTDLKCLLIYNLNLDDPDEIVYHYNADLSDLLDKHAPERTHAVTLRPHSPWFNDSLRKLKTEKRRLERQWMKSGLEIHEQIFTNHVTEYYAVVKATKTRYYKNKIVDADQNRLFKVIDSFFLVEKAVSLPRHDCDLKLANMFGKFFEDKIQDIRNQIVGDCMITDADPVTACIFSMFTEVSVMSVKNTIMASNSKTCPMDPFPTSLLKDCIDFLAPTITYLVNTSFSCGVFPSALKHGRVTRSLRRMDLILRFSRIISQSPIYHFYPKF